MSAAAADTKPTPPNDADKVPRQQPNAPSQRTPDDRIDEKPISEMPVTNPGRQRTGMQNDSALTKCSVGSQERNELP